MESALAGRLLVATPRIGDPNFERTVVLVLAHGEEGAFGVVLNRPSQTEVAELVPAWAGAAFLPSMMFLGGPVAQSAVVGLGVVDSGADPGGIEGWQPIIGGVGTIDLHRDPGDVAAPLSGVRLYAGSAGWSADQLDSELAEGAWWVLDATAADVTTDDPSSLWSRVLRRQPGSVKWFAVFPPDPMVN